jgi:LPXTG-motif cell wall-anchored protein
MTGGSMMRTTRRTRFTAAALSAAVFGAGMAITGIGAASAAGSSPSTVTDAAFAWGLSGEQGGGAFFGGCNFLSAGTAGDTGSSRLWTEGDEFYSTRSGNVTVQKPNAAGVFVQPTWASKCQDSSGAAVSAGSTASLTRNRVLFSQGTGTVDAAANTASIHWTGSFTSAFYGGLTYWSASNPTLTVNADGSAALTATASGYGADMNDASKWVTLAPTTVTLATLHGVAVTSNGFTVTPDYLAVAVSVPSDATAQPARNTGNQAFWGAFPQSFVSFQQLTGQSSYWFTSGGARDAAKPASPLTVGYSALVPAGSSASVSASPTPAATASASTSSSPSASPLTSITPAPNATPTVTATPTTSPTATTSPTPTASPTPKPTATATPKPTATPTPVTYHPKVGLAQNSVNALGDLAFTATGFAPRETVAIVVHSDPVTLTSAVADGNGVISASRTLPSSVPAGSHQLMLTGQKSKAAASSAFTVSPPASCVLSNGVKGGNLVWGFKKSFRSYVGAPAGNSITASGGAAILNQDLAVAGKASSGTYQWPFVSSTSYVSAGHFTAQYGGSVELKYPAHYFSVVISKPRLVVSGNAGTMYANLTLTVSSPTAAPKVDSRTGVALAALDSTGSATGTSAAGITRVLRTAIKDTRAFTFNGSSFYQPGQQLDDATILLSGCVGTGSTGAGGTVTSGTGTGTTGTGTTGSSGRAATDDSLVPALSFRPGADSGSDSLPNTGVNMADLLAVAGLALASGFVFLFISSRRRPNPAGEQQ